MCGHLIVIVLAGVVGALAGAASVLAHRGLQYLRRRICTRRGRPDTPRPAGHIGLGVALGGLTGLVAAILLGEVLGWWVLVLMAASPLAVAATVGPWEILSDCGRRISLGDLA